MLSPEVGPTLPGLEQLVPTMQGTRLCTHAHGNIWVEAPPGVWLMELGHPWVTAVCTNMVCFTDWFHLLPVFDHFSSIYFLFDKHAVYTCWCQSFSEAVATTSGKNRIYFNFVAVSLILHQLLKALCCCVVFQVFWNGHLQGLELGWLSCF